MEMSVERYVLQADFVEISKGSQNTTECDPGSTFYEKLVRLVALNELSEIPENMRAL